MRKKEKGENRVQVGKERMEKAVGMKMFDVAFAVFN